MFSDSPDIQLLLVQEGYLKQPKVYSFIENDYTSEYRLISLHGGFLNAAVILTASHEYQITFFQSDFKTPVGVFYGGQLHTKPGVNESRIERAVEEIQRYSLRKNEKSSGTKRVLSIGSSRVGDYVAQINWLALAIESEGIDAFLKQYSKILIDKSQSFLELSNLFPEIQPILDFNEHFDLASNIKTFDSIEIRNAMPSSFKRNYAQLQNRFKKVPVYGNRFNNGTLKIFVSLELEKRVWLNQEEVIRQVVNELKKSYQSISLVVNGMTGTCQGIDKKVEKVINKEKQIVQQLTSQLDVAVEDLSGRDLFDKYTAIKECHFYIAPIGSATMLPSLLIELPGITVGNTEMLSSQFYRGFVSDNTFIPNTTSVTDDNDLSQGLINWPTLKEKISYTVDQSVIIREVLNIINRKLK
ncbi:hypothetical protein [Alteromonas macleodii]|uniref:hypothetical protein n=1 Tax=Alteromonas macleodii TaxID=28108 RepID=UPI00313C3765